MAGKKNIAKYVYLIVAFLGLIELCSIDGFMGSFLSIIFALCSFFGFAFYLKYEGKIVTDSFKETLSSITTKTGILQIMGDCERVGNSITSFIEKKKLPPSISIEETKTQIDVAKPKEKKSKTQKTK